MVQSLITQGYGNNGTIAGVVTQGFLGPSFNTEQFANFAQSTITSSINASQSVITVANATSFPTLGNFRLVVQSFDPITGLSISAPELMLVTSVSGTQFTVTRGIEGTQAIAFAAGAMAVNILTAAVMRQLQSPAASSITGLATVAITGSYTDLINPPSTTVLLASVSGLNAKTVANTSIYTVPTGKTAVLIGVIVRCTAASAITNGPTAGIGNTAGTSNIYAATAMNALTSPTTTGSTSAYSFTAPGMTSVTTSGGQIYFNLTVAATGTSETVAVDLIGYLI